MRAPDVRQSKFASTLFCLLFSACTSLPVQVEQSPHSHLQTIPGVLEVPVHSKDDKIFKRTGYYVLFDSVKRVPKWVAYKLDKNTSTNKAVPRTDNFRLDVDIENCPNPKDYDFKKNGYDRGHLAPAEDMRWSKAAMDDSFLMSNMTPQSAMLNRNKWRMLEDSIRKRSGVVDAVYVVTGPVLSEPCLKYIAKDICVSENHFKVVLEKRDTTYTAIGYVMPQNPTKRPEEYATSVAEVEKLTGFDFFAELPDEIEREAEGSLPAI